VNPHAKSEILESMQAHATQFTEYLSSLTPEQFFKSSLESWGAAHQTQHLTQTLGMIVRGLSNPDRLPPTPEGVKARDFETIKRDYNTALGGGITVTGNFAPTLEDRTDGAYQSEIIATFQNTVNAFSSALEPWDDQKLDALGMKHPLMGLMPTREMAIFAVYHNTHHEAGIKRRMAKGEGQK
jgi:DinB superfamily